MNGRRTFAVPKKLLKSFVDAVSSHRVTAEQVISRALRENPGAYQRVFEGFENAESPPAGKLTVRMSEADNATLYLEATETGVSEDEYIAHILYSEVFRHELEFMDTIGRADDDSLTADAMPVRQSQIFVRLALNEYCPDDQVVEHVAGLIDAMSRWQVARGGNPLEIDKLLPVGVVGEVVPHE